MFLQYNNKQTDRNSKVRIRDIKDSMTSKATHCERANAIAPRNPANHSTTCIFIGIFVVRLDEYPSHGQTVRLNSIT